MRFCWFRIETSDKTPRFFRSFFPVTLQQKRLSKSGHGFCNGCSFWRQRYLKRIVKWEFQVIQIFVKNTNMINLNSPITFWYSTWPYFISIKIDWLKNQNRFAQCPKNFCILFSGFNICWIYAFTENKFTNRFSLWNYLSNMMLCPSSVSASSPPVIGTEVHGDQWKYIVPLRWVWFRHFDWFDCIKRFIFFFWCFRKLTIILILCCHFYYSIYLSHWSIGISVQIYQLLSLL